MEKRTINYCCTFLGTDTLDENDIRKKLHLSDDIPLTEEDWMKVIYMQIDEQLDIGISIGDFNDVEIEFIK